MRVPFTKMHGLGNDFVLIDAVERPLELTRAQCRALADRRFGVGCDQVLLLEAPARPDSAVRCRIFNADGGEVEHCGNGIRCVGRYLLDSGRAGGSPIRVELAAGLADIQVVAGGKLRVDMGIPRFEPRDIPLALAQRAAQYALTLDGVQYPFAALSMGNPHAVLDVADVDTAPVATLGPRIERHALFPARVNVGFRQLVDAHRIRLRVFERGVGETLACGTGACAAAVAGIASGALSAPVTVALPGGELHIEWHGEGTPVWMTGPATRVFSGEIEL